MTTAEAIAKNKNMVAELKNMQFMLDAVLPTHADFITRLFVRGEFGDGAKRQYSTLSSFGRGMYVNPRTQSPKAFPTGKFKNGNPRKTKHFKTYKEFRAAIGRETGFVNLRLTEFLKLQLQNSIQIRGNSVIVGVNGNANPNKSPSKGSNVKKVEGLIKKYGEVVFKLQQKEIDKINQRILKKITEKLTGA